jgi:hypothetical protein
MRTFEGEDMKKCPLGLYKIFWKSGGSSLAAIGNMYNGVRWIAPINWTAQVGEDPTGRMNDKMVKSILKIVLVKE